MHIGIHLILLRTILGNPGIIIFFLIITGSMYMIDTAAHFMLPDHETYSSIFLALVAVPSIIGEMSLAVWLLVNSGKE